MEPSVKGNMINLAKVYLIKTFGPDAVDKMIKQMESQDREILTKPILTGSWYPVKTQVNLLATAEKIFGKGDYELCRKIGYHNAKAVVPKIYRFFVRFGNPHFVIRNASRFWRQTQNNGRFEIASSSPKSTTGHLVDFAFPHKAFCSMMRGFCQATLEMSGAKNVSIHETKCVTKGAGFCEYIASWK